jgi:hypothetical protein
MLTSSIIDGMPLIHWPAIAAVVVASLIQTPPVPKPFPQPGQPPAKTEPARPDPAKPEVPAMAAGQAQPSAAPSGVPSEATLGAPVYPTAEFLESFDAGRGQRYFIFGTNAAYTEIVAYYKTVMKNGGRTLFEAPAMQQWDLAKFQDQTMAFQPSVVVKDYTWGGAEGYLFVNGTTEKRFKTVIQIVPAPTPIR